MTTESIVFYIFLIFTGAAVLATLALYARQSLLVVYILLGVLAGPSAFGLVSDDVVIKQIAHIGVIFLLFLIGINLPPQKLLLMLRKTSVIAGVSSLLFFVLGMICGLLFGFGLVESGVIGAALMFSSTIIGLKLLPTFAGGAWYMVWLVVLLKLGVFVACTPDFVDQPQVANGASDLFVEVMGEIGRHARFAVGAPSLPLGVPVEIDAVVELMPGYGDAPPTGRYRQG